MKIQKVLKFTFGGFAGKDWWRNFLTPRMQTKHVAKRCLRQLWPNADFSVCPHVINMPHGSFRIVDHQGNVEPYVPDDVDPNVP